MSCETCLDQVNTLLDLPLISTRFPTDTLGKDRGSKRGPSDGSGGSSSGGGMEPPDRGSAVAGSVQTSKRRAREVFEHRPKELHIAVNGNIQASQKINAEVNEQTLDVNQGDAVSFVEVFSEQDVRLLLFAVDAPPPSGAYEQSRRVQFSDGRSLEATFAFTNPWPTLHVVYFDPLLASEAIEDVLESESLTAASDDQPAKSHSDQKTIEETRSKLSASTTENFLTRSFAEWVGRVRAFNWGFFLKPGSITALLALMLIAVLVFVETRQPVTPLTAATLLEQAAQQEDLLAARTDIAFHRTLQLEERNAAGATLSRRKIEIWQSAEKGITARREYDERGLLVAGDWRRRDGVETIYHHGARPQIQFQNPQSAVRSFADVWEWTPSAKEFSALTAINAQNYVEETDSSYLVTYEPRQTNASGQGLVRATLNLSKPDLRARDATLILRQGEDVREFRFVETSFEQPAAGSVAPAVFEPEPELLSSAKTETSNSRLETANTLSPLPLTPLPVSASADLEIEVLRLLHQAGADLGEQISVMRTTEGLLHIQGVLETTERKNELLRALDSVKTNPAVKIQLSSAAEALQRLPKSSSPGSITVERTDSGTNTLPVDAELRRYFAGKGMSEEQTAANVRRFANNVVERSSQVLQHAWALKRLTERFSPDELRNLTPEARAHWLAMIGEHCRTLEQTNAALRQDLQPIFFPAFPADSGEEGIEIKNDGDLVRATERLLGICTSNHKLLTAAFTVSSDASNAAAIKSPQFLRSLRSAERLSTRIGSAARGSE